MTIPTRAINALGAACLALCLGGCPDEPDDAIFPDRDTIPEPTLERDPEPYPPEPYTPAPGAYDHEDAGALERAGEELDEAAEDTGEVLRDGVEDAGDAADEAGEWVEEQTDRAR